MKDKIISIEKEEKNKNSKYGKNHVRNKVLVNLITSVRALGTVGIIPIFLNCGSFVTALTAMGILVTDFIDGFLARKLNVQSFFGALLDAVSDKAFGIICLLLLSSLNPIFFVVIGIELGIFAINYKSAQNDNNVKTSSIGRAKTVLLAATIVGSFFCYDAPTLKEVLNYINVSCFDKLLEINPDILTTILATPIIGVNAYVAKDYLSIAKKQEQEREQTKEKEEEKLEVPVAEKSSPAQDGALTLEEIATVRQGLLKQKEELMVFKTREELLHDLFDTDFYITNKSAPLKSLLYKKG